jgi:hypothetical protein
MTKKTELEDLKTQEAVLERRLADIRVKRMALERKEHPAKESARPLRDVVLDTLADANFPLNSLLLANIMRPLYGRVITSNRFGTLSNDEVKSYESSRARPVYLCHGLTYDSGQAVKRFWARSVWPLADRIMGPMSGRILFFKGAAWTIGLAQSVEEGTRSADNLDILKYVAADQARDAGLTVKRGEFPYEDWLTAIAAAIDRHTDADRILREESADALAAKLTERELLFGSSKGLVSLPGSNASWRSAIE